MVGVSPGVILTQSRPLPACRSLEIIISAPKVLSKGYTAVTAIRSHDNCRVSPVFQVNRNLNFTIWLSFTLLCLLKLGFSTLPPGLFHQRNIRDLGKWLPDSPPIQPVLTVRYMGRILPVLSVFAPSFTSPSSFPFFVLSSIIHQNSSY